MVNYGLCKCDDSQLQLPTRKPAGMATLGSGKGFGKGAAPAPRARGLLLKALPAAPLGLSPPWRSHTLPSSSPSHKHGHLMVPRTPHCPTVRNGSHAGPSPQMAGSSTAAQPGSTLVTVPFLGRLVTLLMTLVISCSPQKPHISRTPTQKPFLQADISRACGNHFRKSAADDS